MKFTGFAVTWLLMFFFLTSYGQQKTGAGQDVKTGLKIVVKESGNGVHTFIATDTATGRVMSISRQGVFNGCGVPVGTDTIFSPTGKVYQTVRYTHHPGKPSGSCHDLRTIARTTTYFHNGKVMEVSSHHYCYECEPVPCGVWKRYNDKGKLVERSVKGDCR